MARSLRVPAAGAAVVGMLLTLGGGVAMADSSVAGQPRTGDRAVASTVKKSPPPRVPKGQIKRPGILSDIGDYEITPELAKRLFSYAANILKS